MSGLLETVNMKRLIRNRRVLCNMIWHVNALNDTYFWEILIAHFPLHVRLREWRWWMKYVVIVLDCTFGIGIFVTICCPPDEAQPWTCTCITMHSWSKVIRKFSLSLFSSRVLHVSHTNCKLFTHHHFRSSRRHIFLADDNWEQTTHDLPRAMKWKMLFFITAPHYPGLHTSFQYCSWDAKHKRNYVTRYAL